MKDDVENVDPQEAKKDNSPIRESVESCMWNGKEYSDGAQICSDDTLYECQDGSWVTKGTC